MELTKKIIVITGATSGIGKALAQRLNQKNHVVALGRDETKLAELKKELPQITTYKVDLSIMPELTQVGENIAQDYPKIDLLINNAAVQFTPTFDDAEFNYQTIETEITTNFTAPIALISLLLPSLQAQKTGAAILNINSGLGLAAKTTSAVYCGTKGGLNLFSQSLGYQLEPYQIKVMQAFLPLVKTPMTKGRGGNKLTLDQATTAIIQGITKGRITNDIGKVKFLRLLLRYFPTLGQNILKRS